MKTRRTARTIVVWIALLLLIASWLFPYCMERNIAIKGDGFYFLFSPGIKYLLVGYTQIFLIDLTLIALAAGFLFMFRGGHDR